MQVGGEVAGFAHHGAALGIVAQRGDDRLEQVGRGGVADDYLVRLRADQRGDQTAEALRRVDPAFVPAADQPFAPLPLHRVGERGGDGAGQNPKRIAIEVDHALRQREGVAVAGERIGGVKGAGLVAGHAGSFARAARMSARVAAQAAVPGAMSATCPVSGMVWRSTESPAACACAT